MALQRLKRTAMMPGLLQKVAPRIYDPHISSGVLASASIICQRGLKTYGNCLPILPMLESEPAQRKQVKNKHKERGGVSRARRQSRKLSIAIIGAGRVGLALGRAAQASGHGISLAIARTGANARRASRLLGTAGASLGTRAIDQLSSEHRGLLKQSNLLLIATPDDSISEVADQIARVFKTSRTDRRYSRWRVVALHTSGALASDVLKPIRDQGVATGSLHPLVSISGAPQAPRTFAGVYFSVEGDAAAVRLGKQLVRDIDGNSFVMNPDRKPLYHAAALMASPNLTALIDIAVEMMSRCGFGSSEARKMLIPLIVSTIDNLTLQDPRAALTGTFKRGDIATARIHLDAIASERLTDALEAYVVLGRRSLKLSEISETKKRAIESLLKNAIKR
jgi:predicted short-subunit dehydrogenase-like oxidoreductase (DUF2520 family)